MTVDDGHENSLFPEKMHGDRPDGGREEGRETAPEGMLRITMKRRETTCLRRHRAALCEQFRELYPGGNGTGSSPLANRAA
ncbi:MAG: hypothetical protein BHW59_06955 [Desulfovibrio piger]|nr:MAG: hypothetical protein BHW59_06955 [Desulfovibrio piger]